MIFPGAGTSSDWDYDYVQLVTTSTIADYGKNWTNFWNSAGEMPELKLLKNLVVFVKTNDLMVLFLSRQ